MLQLNALKEGEARIRATIADAKPISLIPSQQTIKALNFEELMLLRMPPREYVLSPILPVKGLMMVHAPRGTGKTWFVMSLACAIASGGDMLGFKADKPRKALLIDGEMAMSDLQERLSKVVANLEQEITDHNNLKIIAADFYENGLPDLSNGEGSEKLMAEFNDADVIIFDNLSTLFTSLKESENDDCQKATALFLDLKRKGKTVIIVHHSGKNGAQRGASRREDTLNTVIALRRPDDCDEVSGCVFNVEFEKNRGFFGKDAEGFRAELVTSEQGGVSWHRVEILDALLGDILRLKAEGMKQREIALELGISLSKVNRILKAASKEA